MLLPVLLAELRLSGMPMQPTQIRLVDYPTGTPTDETWAISHDPAPELRDGEIEIDVQFVSVDPGMKAGSAMHAPLRQSTDPSRHRQSRSGKTRFLVTPREFQRLALCRRGT